MTHINPDDDLWNCVGIDGLPKSFSPENIVEIVGEVPGDADGPDWFWLLKVKVKDIEMFTVFSGGCDYSGWG